MLRVIDIATTGSDASADAIVSLTSIDLQRGGLFTNTQSVIVAQAKPIPPEASALHHLLDEDVSGAPPLRDVIDAFDGADAYVTMNAEREAAFLTPIFGVKTWICIRRCAMRVWPNLKGYDLHAIRYALDLRMCLGVERKHITPGNPRSNCVVIGAIFEAMVKAGTKFSDMQQWSLEPALLPFFEYGPHRGVPVSSVPKEYLIMLTTAKDRDRDMEFTAFMELARRKEAA